MRSSVPKRVDDLRRSFWLLPAVGIAVGLVVGFGLVELDYRLDLSPPVLNFVDLQSARGVLQTVATVTVSVVGLSFSVILVALQLASQQLSPRVLRTFQGDRLAQSVLAVFIGTFIYCLIVLAKLREVGVPALSISLAVLGAVVAFGLFVAFIHHIIVYLKPSALIERIGKDGRGVIEQRWPQAARAPASVDDARREVERRSRRPGLDVRASRGGFVTEMQAEDAIALATRHDLLVIQRAEIGSYVLTGSVLATVHGADDRASAVADEIRRSFVLGQERSVIADIGFPIRQLADIALRGLSPSLNDPTTAENAIDGAADLLVRIAAAEEPSPIRVDQDGTPRLIALVPSLDDLVRLAFEQVRTAAAGHPAVARHVIGRLAEIAGVAEENGLDSTEVRRQARLMSEAPAGVVPTDEDALAVRMAYSAGDGGSETLRD